VALVWEGGFLGGTRVHLNENLNVLVGGRGAGKSTIVESLRFVLGMSTDADEAKRLHEGIIQKVLRAGTKVILLVRGHRPAPREYVIERTVGTGKPIVRDGAGKPLDISPADVLPDIEIYGQHEISELTRHPERLTRLLTRFIVRDAARDQHKRELAGQLAANRRATADALTEIATTEEALAALPGLEERLRRFNEAGLKEKLAERREVELDDQHLRSLAKSVVKLREAVASARTSVPKVTVGKARSASPHAPLMNEADQIVADLAKAAAEHFDGIDHAIDDAEVRLERVRERWQTATTPVEERYQKMLRELQSNKLKGDEYIAVEGQIAELRPLDTKVDELRSRVKALGDTRRGLLRDWDEAKAEEFRATKKAADAVSKALAGRVRVRVTFAGDREPLVVLLDQHLTGRKIETLAAARAAERSPTEFAAQIRAGKDALTEAYGLTAGQAEKLAQLPLDVVMQVEELDLPPATDLDLNTAPKDQAFTWRSLSELSTGQRATTVLLLLLLGSDAPLVIDQPEDDLDNRFISDEVVPRMKDEKRRRQFIFSTHNANIPVLADAELILGMAATADGATIPPEHMGAIDAQPVRELVEEVLEGGREAFLLRKRKYRF
jgi:ABC-type cobalamin/Fe3+-siderophores transport system ATPase subunit